MPSFVWECYGLIYTHHWLPTLHNFLNIFEEAKYDWVSSSHIKARHTSFSNIQLESFWIFRLWDCTQMTQNVISNDSQEAASMTKWMAGKTELTELWYHSHQLPWNFSSWYTVLATEILKMSVMSNLESSCSFMKDFLTSSVTAAHCAGRSVITACFQNLC